MDNDYKTNFVEPQENVALADVEQPRDDELTAKALEEIHSTERLSGFGRFAIKLQNFFQASKASQSKQGLSHLKMAPIMMSAGLLLLFATGLLFLLSKPESAVPSHFRQPTVLAGSDGQKNAATAPTDVKSQSSPQPELQLPAGTEIVAHTTNAISSGLESPVVAVVDRSVKVGDTVVIPEGAHVIGHTAGAAKDRINVRFTSVVLPNDREIPISGLGLMKDGTAGLVGRVKGKGNPVLAGAARVGTGAAVVATEFAGQGSSNQPFSQADYLRNQMAAEVASQGSQLSNRWQQTMSVPIVAVDANQSITIFLLDPLTLSGKTSRGATARSQVPQVDAAAEQSQPSEQDLVAAQTAYIQALEAQLAEMRSANGKKANEHQ